MAVEGGGGGELGMGACGAKGEGGVGGERREPGACCGFGARRAGEDKRAARRRRPAKTAVGKVAWAGGWFDGVGRGTFKGPFGKAAILLET
jgi:hypothetical protein